MQLPNVGSYCWPFFDIIYETHLYFLHFRWLQKTEEIEQEEKDDTKPQLDLSLKEGQMITINMKIGVGQWYIVAIF